MGKLDRKSSALPDLEDCCKWCQLCSSFCTGRLNPVLLFKNCPHRSISEQRDMHALSFRTLGRQTGCSELPQKTGEEASSSRAKSDLCGDPTGGGGRAWVPAHTKAKQRLCLLWVTWSYSSLVSNESNSFFLQVCWLAFGSFHASHMRRKMLLRRKRCCVLRSTGYWVPAWPTVFSSMLER